MSIISFGWHLLPRYYCDGIVDCPLKDDENNKDCGTTTTPISSLTSSTESSTTKETTSAPKTSTLGTSTPSTKKITESSSTEQTFVTHRTIIKETVTSATGTLINGTSTALPDTSTTEKSTLLTTIKTTSNKETSTYTPKQSSTTTASAINKTNEPTVTTSQPTTANNKSSSTTTVTETGEISSIGSVSPTTVILTTTSTSTHVSTGTPTTAPSSTTITSTTSSTSSASSTGIRTKSIPTTSTTPASLTSTRSVTSSSCKVSPKVYLCSDNSKCINSTQICDIHPDCDNKEDEKNCPKFCQPCLHDFKCHRTCQCMSEVFICDGDKDCEDGSDEIACPPITTTTQTSTIYQSTGTSQTTKIVQTSTTQLPITPCTNNKVLKKCVKDCEHKCPYLLTNCIESQRECKLGCGCADGLVSNGTFCLLLSSCSCYDSVINDYRNPGERWERNCQVCTCFNGQTRCSPKECAKLFCKPPLELVKEPGECCEKCKPKETGPTTTTVTTQKICLEDEFMCSNGKCIPEEWECDHERDCFDASDERFCNETKPKCFKPLGTAF